PHRAGAAVELLDAVLRFEDVVAGVPVERRVFYGAHASGQEAELASGRDQAVEKAAAKAEAAAATLAAIETARKGAVEKAQSSLKKSAAETGYQFSDELMQALPSVAPAAPAAPAPAREQSEVVRRAHDKAMKVLQTH